MPTFTTQHMQIDLRNALRHWDPTQWEGVCTSSTTGEMMTPEEVKEEWETEVRNGRFFSPLCHDADCPGFDYVNGGCPGHPQIELQVVACFDSLQPRTFQLTVTDNQLASEAQTLFLIFQKLGTALVKQLSWLLISGEEEIVPWIEDCDGAFAFTTEKVYAKHLQEDYGSGIAPQN